MIQYIWRHDIMLTSLYIHIPFCKHICTYCDFHKEVATLDKKKSYIQALIKEIKNNQSKIKNVKTIYIGGGTPTSLPYDLLESLLKTLTSVIELSGVIEYTIEGNPDDITDELVKLIKKYGINRISLGVQTSNDTQLKFLHRTHNNKNVRNAVSILKKHGLTNINIDMIFNLPNQTKEELQLDIDFLLSLDVPHTSYYSLILEEKSILYHLIKKKQVSIQDQDVEGDMYLQVIQKLKEAGYEHYEISNFTKDKKSHHNLSYWTNKDYLGLGSGAHSKMEDKRYFNPSNVSKYISDILENKQTKTEYDCHPLEDEMMMGLRLIKGIDLMRINKEYKVDVIKKYQLNKYIDQGFLQVQDNLLSFTEKGLLVGNEIFMIFMEV